MAPRKQEPPSAGSKEVNPAVTQGRPRGSLPYWSLQVTQPGAGAAGAEGPHTCRS